MCRGSRLRRASPYHRVSRERFGRARLRRAAVATVPLFLCVVLLERAHPHLTFLQRANSINTGLGRAQGSHNRNFLRDGGIANRDLVFTRNFAARAVDDKTDVSVLYSIQDI